MSRAEYVTLPLRAAPALPPGERCESCGKHRFATEEAAALMLGRLHRIRGDTGKVECRAYYVHGWWHLTSEPERTADERHADMQGA